MGDKDLIKAPESKPEKTPEDSILAGAKDFSEFLDDIEQTVFLCDTSGSMSSPINAGEQTTKIELLKKSLDRYLERRFQKNAHSRVGLVAFETSVHVLVEITDNEAEIRKAVKGLHPMGSTRMHKGLQRAINLLKKTSRSWIPRIVLISDGMPDSQQAVVDVMDQYQHLRIVVDAIYIGPQSEWDSVYVEFMRQLAIRTGGVFEMITGEADFQQKFLKVAERLLIGAGKPGKDEGEKGPIIL